MVLIVIAGFAAVMMIYERSRVELALKARPGCRRDEIDVFAGEGRSCAEFRVYAADLLQRIPTKGEIGSLQDSGREETVRREFLGLLAVVHREPKVILVPEQNAPPHVADIGAAPERLDKVVDIA